MSKQLFSFRTVVGLILLISSTSARADDNSLGGHLKSIFGRVKATLTSLAHSVQQNAPEVGTTSPISSTPTAALPTTATANTNAPSTQVPNSCSPIGPQRVAVILANYDGAPAGTATPNVDYVRELFLGANHDFSVSDYYKTISSGRTWFSSVTVLGPYQSPKPFVVDPTVNGGMDTALDQWETDLVALASKDQDFTQIDRVVFLTPNAIDATGASVPMGAGLAAQGICDLDSVNTDGIHRPLAHAWVLASTAYLGATADRITNDPSSLTTDELNAGIRHLQMLDMAPITHELGHTFGLGHANQVNRPQTGYSNQFMNNEILPGATDTLYENSYADPFSVMGAGEIQWLNVAHLTQLGWLDTTTETEEVRSEGTFRIYPLEGAMGTLKGLKIPRVIQSPNESTVSDLWVEFRQRTSVYDTELSNTHTTAGAIVHYTNPKQPGPNSMWPFETVLLNFHPDGQLVNPYETDLTLTTSWKDDHSMVQIDIVDATTSYIDVHVSFVSGTTTPSAVRGF